MTFPESSCLIEIIEAEMKILQLRSIEETKILNRFDFIVALILKNILMNIWKCYLI